MTVTWVSFTPTPFLTLTVNRAEPPVLMVCADGVQDDREPTRPAGGGQTRAAETAGGVTAGAIKVGTVPVPVPPLLLLPPPPPPPPPPVVATVVVPVSAGPSWPVAVKLRCTVAPAHPLWSKLVSIRTVGQRDEPNPRDCSVLVPGGITNGRASVNCPTAKSAVVRQRRGRVRRAHRRDRDGKRRSRGVVVVRVEEAEVDQTRRDPATALRRRCRSPRRPGLADLPRQRRRRERRT